MPVNINCSNFRHEGKCTHQAAPRTIFRSAICIVWEYWMSEKTGPRQTEPNCALCTPYQKPLPPPPTLFTKNVEPNDSHESAIHER
jgi:hypothetical protein